MIKTILLAKRKPGLTAEEFREYYETRHAVLAGKTMAHCARYTRNYPIEAVGTGVGWDVVTEFWFDLEGPWNEAHARIVDDARAAVLAADELEFMDRASMRCSVVLEQESDPRSLTGVTIQSEGGE